MSYLAFNVYCVGVAEPAKDTHTSPLVLDTDVDTSVLAVKYELTGGFIKNAVLSALLSALSRDKSNPIIKQADLIEGCKLQMRGNLTQRNFEDRVVGKTSLSQLHLTQVQKTSVQKIIRHEKARPKVFGSWNATTSATASAAGGAAGGKGGVQSPHCGTPCTDTSTSVTSPTTNTTTATKTATASAAASGPASGASTTATASAATIAAAAATKPNKVGSHCDQKASIHLFAGTRGSGKTTLAKAIAAELDEKRIKMLHVADFVSGNISDITHMFTTLIHDARLMDALIVIDGFEHIIEDTGGGGGAGVQKVHLLLSRIMDILYQYHGKLGRMSVYDAYNVFILLF